MGSRDETLVDRWLRRLKNSPVVAVLIVAGVVVSAVAAFWQGLPASWKDSVSASAARPSAGPDNGWLFAGYLDPATERLWASPPHVRVVRPSGAPDRSYPIRIGDVVTPTSPRRQVIVGFQSSGTEHVLTPPVELREVIQAEDYTGRVLRPGEQFEVADVEVSRIPGGDPSVWLRLVPYTPPGE